MGKTTSNKFLFVSLAEYQLLSHFANNDESISLVRVSELKKSDIDILNKLISRQLCCLVKSTTHFDNGHPQYDIFTCVQLNPETLQYMRNGVIHPTFFEQQKFTFWIGCALGSQIKHSIEEVRASNYLLALEILSQRLREKYVLPIFWESHCIISWSCASYNIFK